MNQLSPLSGMVRQASPLVAAAVAVARAQPWAMGPACVPGCATTPEEDGAVCLSCGTLVRALGGTLLGRGPEAAACVEAHWIRGEALDPPALARAYGIGLNLAHALAIAVEDLDPHGPEVEIVRVHAWMRDRRRPARAPLVPAPVRAPVPATTREPEPPVARPRRGVTRPEPEPMTASAPAIRVSVEAPVAVAEPKVRYVREAVSIPTERWADRQVERSRRTGWPSIPLDLAVDLVEDILSGHPSARIRAHDAQAVCAARTGDDGAAALASLKAYGLLLTGADGRLAVTATGRDAMSADPGRRALATGRAAAAPPPYADVLRSLGPAPDQAAFAGLPGLSVFTRSEVAAIHQGYVLAMAMRAAAQAVAA